MTPFDKLKTTNENYDGDVLKVVKEYIGLCQEFGLVASRVEEDVEGREVRKVSKVRVVGNSAIIDFEFEGISKTFQLRIHEEAYDNIIDPEKYYSNWKHCFFEETSEFIEERIEEEMKTLGKWLERADKIKKYLEKESED